MARRVPREMSVEEYDDWSSATKKFEQVAEAADEVGGPRLSLVPLPEQNIAWPTDLLPPAPDCSPVEAGDQPEAGGGVEIAPIPAMPFDGIPLESSRKRLAGWSAERQRLFLTVLA